MSEQTTVERPKTKPRFSRQQVLIVLGLLAINLAIYGGIWLLKQNNESRTRAPAATAGETLELREAYKQALALALSWQSDAQLASAMTSWQVSSGDRLTLNRSAWSFQFYSPSAHQVELVSVDAQGPRAGRRQAVNTALQDVVPDWSVDSDDLLLTFLSYGGQEFISAYPRANVHLQLKSENTGRSMWYVTAVDPVARQSLMVGVDAHSRQVVMSEKD